MTTIIQRDGSADGELRVRTRAFTLTCNNWTDKDLAAFKSLVRREGFAVGGLAIVGSEGEGEDETPHLQAFLWKGKTSATNAAALKKQLKKAGATTGWHIEPAKDKPPYNRAVGYCCKGHGGDTRYSQAESRANGIGWETFNVFSDSAAASDANILFQWGTQPAQGSRSDVAALAAAARDTSRPLSDMLLEDDALAASFIRYPNGCKALRQMASLSQPRHLTTEPTVVVLWGKTGTGKTHHINDLIKHIDQPHYVLNTGQGSSGGTVWFDGYDNQKVVWFSEFRSSLPFSKFLEICDKYECKAQCKNGMVQIQAETIFICSPTDPSTWYKNLEDRDGLIEQLTRRITHSVKMDGSRGSNRSLECTSKLTAVYNHFGFNVDGTEYFDDAIGDIADSDFDMVLAEGLIGNLLDGEDELDFDANAPDPEIDLPVVSPAKRRRIRRAVLVDTEDEDSEDEVIAAGYAEGFNPGAQSS